MTSVTSCVFSNIRPDDLQLMVGAFPAVRTLTLRPQIYMDDTELLMLSVCTPQLTRLELFCCGRVSPLEVMVLYQQLSNLHHITHFRCALMQGCELELGLQYLQGCHSLAEVVPRIEYPRNMSAC